MANQILSLASSAKMFLNFRRGLITGGQFALRDSFDGLKNCFVYREMIHSCVEILQEIEGAVAIPINRGGVCGRIKP